MTAILAQGSKVFSHEYQFRTMVDCSIISCHVYPGTLFAEITSDKEVVVFGDYKICFCYQSNFRNDQNAYQAESVKKTFCEVIPVQAPVDSLSKKETEVKARFSSAPACNRHSVARNFLNTYLQFDISGEITAELVGQGTSSAPAKKQEEDLNALPKVTDSSYPHQQTKAWAIPTFTAGKGDMDQLVKRPPQITALPKEPIETVPPPGTSVKVQVKSVQEIPANKKAAEQMESANDQALTGAIGLLQAGVKGDRDAAVKAHGLLEKLLGLKKDNPLIQAYFGSAVCLLGRDATDYSIRLTKANEGLKILDQAVKNAPDNTQVRMLRATVCYRLPEMYFHRTKTAIEDFTYLAARYDGDQTILTQEAYWQILYNLGAALKNTGRPQEAYLTWSKLLGLTTDPEYAALLKKEGLEPGSASQNGAPVPPPAPSEAGILEENDKSVLNDGLDLHRSALNGDKDATGKAFDFFAKAHDTYPGDNLVAAYYADCLSMTGRDAPDSDSKFKKAYEAIQIFDQAVLNCPENPQIRFLRAYHGFRLPEAFFHRTAVAIEDFSYLVLRYEQDHSLFPPEIFWQLIFDLGLACRRLEREEEAQQAWAKLTALGPSPGYQELVDSQQVPDVSEIAALHKKEELFKEGKVLLELAADGNAMAAKISCEILKKLYEMQPSSPEVMACYGSSLALAGRYATDPSAMFGNAHKGIKMLKTASTLAPDDLEIMLRKALLTASLPEPYFPPDESVVEDLLQLRSACEKDQGALPPGAYWKILYNLGKVFKQSGDNEKAQEAWSALLAQCPDSGYSKLVKLQ